MSIETRNAVSQAQQNIESLIAEVNRAAVSNRDDMLAAAAVVCLNGAGLYEGPYGTGKTFTTKAIAAATGGTFGRSQGTPDLLPADITGTDIYDPRTGEFTPSHGPIFSNIFLMDELPRLSAKSQSALLEATGERQVTLPRSGTHTLPENFAMFATANPVTKGESSPITGAQRDRFMVSIESHLTAEQQRDIARRDIAIRQGKGHVLQPAVSQDELVVVRNAIAVVNVSDPALDLIQSASVDVVAHELVDTEESANQVQDGVRKTLDLTKLAQFFAVVRGREEVSADDVKRAAPYVLAHRIILDEVAYDKGMNAHQIVRDVVGAPAELAA